MTEEEMTEKEWDEQRTALLVTPLVITVSFLIVVTVFSIF